VPNGSSGSSGGSAGFSGFSSTVSGFFSNLSSLTCLPTRRHEPTQDFVGIREPVKLNVYDMVRRSLTLPVRGQENILAFSSLKFLFSCG
jgi:hypothetical protein